MMKQNPILPGIGQSNTASKEGKSYLELRAERKQNATAPPKTSTQASFAQPASKSTSPNNNGKRTYLSQYSSAMKPTEAQYTNREKNLQGLSDADFITEVRTNGLGGRLPSMQNGKNMSGLMPNSFKRFQDTFVTKVDSTMKGVSKNLGGGQWLDAQSLYAIEKDINSLDRDFKVMKAAGYDIDDSIIGKYRDVLKEAREIYGQYANADEYNRAVEQQKHYQAFEKNYQSGNVDIIGLYSAVKNDEVRERELEQSLKEDQYLLDNWPGVQPGHTPTKAMLDEQAVVWKRMERSRMELADLKKNAPKRHEEYVAYWAFTYNDMQNAKAESKIGTKSVADSLDGDIGEIYRALLYLQDPKSKDNRVKPFSSVDIDGNDIDLVKLSRMTDNEKDLFFYLCNKGEADKAMTLMRDVADQLVVRYSSDVAEFLDVPVIREAVALANGAVKGVKNIGYGLASTFVDMDAPKSSEVDYMQSYWAEKHKGSLSGFTTGAASSIGNMIPAIAGYAIHPAVGMSASFFNARGNAYAEAKEKGANHQQAWLYSSLSGAAEVCLQSLLGGAGGMIGGSLTGLAKSKFGQVFTKFASSKLGKLVTAWIADTGGEVLEENLQLVLDPVFQMFSGMADHYELPKKEEFIETTIVTAISSSVFFGVNQTQEHLDEKHQAEYTAQVKKTMNVWEQLPESSNIYEASQALRRHFEENDSITPLEYMSIVRKYADAGTASISGDKVTQSPSKTETEQRADMVQEANPNATVLRSDSVQAYIDTGKVTLKNAQKEKAATVLDAIVSGEKTELSNNEIDSLMLTTTSGSQVASKLLGIEVPRFSEKATARTQFRSIVNQYMQTRAESQNTAPVATEQIDSQNVQPIVEDVTEPMPSPSDEAYDIPDSVNDQASAYVTENAPEVVSADSDFSSATFMDTKQDDDSADTIDVSELLSAVNEVTDSDEFYDSEQLYGRATEKPRMGYAQFEEKYRQYFNKNATDNELGTAYHRYSNPNEDGEYHGVRPSAEVFNLPVETVRAIDELGKLFGLDISFEDLGKDNGYYITGTNKVVMDIKPMRSDADSAFLFTAAHELGHAIRDRIGKEAWSAFEKYAVTAMGGEKAVKAKQKQNDVYKNPTEAREDVACDFLGKLMSDKNTLDTFCKAVEKGQFNAEYAKGIGGLMQKIVDRINSAKLSKAIRKRWGKDIANAKNAAQAILKAAEAALPNYGENGNATEVDTKRAEAAEIDAKIDRLKREIEYQKSESERPSLESADRHFAYIYWKAAERELKALEAAKKVKENTTEKGSERYSIKRTQNMSWSEQISGALYNGGNIRRNDTLIVCHSTDTIVSDVVTKRPLAIPLSVLSKAQSGKDISHSIKKGKLAKLDDGIKNAEMVIVNPSRNAIVYVTNIKQGGIPIVVSFDIDATFDGDKVHKATSIHLQIGLDSMLRSLPDSATIYAEKKELDPVGATNILRGLAAKIKFIDTIADKRTDVKEKKSVKDNIDVAKHDAYYMAAVESGDMETAQRMVDEAAKKAGYTSSDDWRMAHRAPTRTDDTARSMDQIDSAYGGDGSIYSFRAVQYYGEGRNYDRKAFNVIRSARSNPDKLITVYRAVPTDIQDSRVRNGDWIAITREYAVEHGERMFNEGYRILENKVPAKHIYGNGDSIHEWGYDNGDLKEVYKNAPGNVKLAAVTYDDNGNVIPLSERFNEKKTDIRYSKKEFESAGTEELYKGKDLSSDSSVYDYDFLVSLPPMHVPVMPSLSSVKAFDNVKNQDNVSPEKAAELGMENARAYGGNIDNNGTVYLKNRYTGHEIKVSVTGLRHSIDGDKQRLRTNARLSSIGGDLIVNAVPINGLKDESPTVNGTYAMAVLANSGSRNVVAIITVEMRTNNLLSIDFSEITHSISGRLVKKESNVLAARAQGNLNEAPYGVTLDISIADFLSIVNRTYQSILPEDVLNHFKEKRDPKGHYSSKVKFSKKDTGIESYEEDYGTEIRTQAQFDRAKDEAHLAAVRYGDLRSAQRMVNKAARQAMPDSVAADDDGHLLYMYHGTSNGGFTVFDPYSSNFGLFGQGSYFTDNPDVATGYTKKGHGNNNQVYKCFLNIKNPIDMDAPVNIEGWKQAFENNDLDVSYLDDVETNEDAFKAMKEALADELYTKYEAYEVISSALYGMGYDGITHIGGGRFNKNDEIRHRVYIAFDPEQIKSAEPVTYDNSGNVIPLSERFNEKNPDIRYSKKEINYKNRSKGLSNANIPSYDELVKKADIQIVDIRHNSESIKELKKKFKGSEAYLEMMNAPVDNYDTNTSIFFSNKSYSHSLSNPGGEQIQALYHLRKIVQNAVLTHKEPSKKAPDDNCIGVYTFFGAVRSEKGIQPVKLKVKEYEIVGQAIPETVQKYLIDGNDMVDYALLYDSRVLLIEDIEKEDVSSSAASTNANSAKADNYPSTSSTIRIADLINLVNGKSLLYIPKKKITSKIPTPEEARYLERYRVAEEQARIEKENNLKQAVTRDIVSKAIGNPNSTSKKHSIKTIDELVDEFGSIPTGENPTRTVEIPNRITSDTKVRRTVRTAMEAAVTPDSMISLIEDRIIEGSFGYNPVTNKQRMQSAYEWVSSRDIGSALNEWLFDVGSGKLTADLSARGMLLYNNYVNASATETDVDERNKAERNAADILAALSSLTTVGAQITQFNRMLKKLSPETQIYALERNVKKLQSTINRELEALKRPKIELKLNSEWMEMWAKELRRGPLADSDFLYSIEGVIFADIAKQVPKRFIDKWNAWRYLSMLGNPKTLVRNTFGNALFMPAKALKDAIGTGLERIFIKDASKRTKALKGDKDVKQFAKQDYKSSDVKRLIDTGNGKYSMENVGTRLEKAIRDAHRNFDAWGLRHWQKATNYIMNHAPVVSDSAFMSHHYETSFARIAKARGITAKMLSDGAVNQETLDEMRAYAVNEALKATYKDVNAVSKAMSKLKSKNKLINMALEGTIPFKATPANVMVRAVEYSPIGFIESTWDYFAKVKKGEMSTSEFLDGISSNLSGTAICLLGWLLASMGMIRVGADDDEKREGKQNYSLEIGDWSITLDWVAPASIPFFMGASMRTILGADNGANFLDAVKDSVSTFFAPMLEMSMLSGMQDLLDTFAYGDGLDFGQMMMAFFVQPFFSYIGQAVPTILGQFANTFETNRTTTYVGDISGQVSRNVVRMLAKITEKIPFVDWWQMDYVDTFGRKDPNGSWYGRVFHNFINPAYVNEINVTDPDAEIRRLEEVTGEEISPKRPDYSITVTQYDSFGKKLSSEKIALTADQFEAYSTAYGQQYVLMMTEMMASTFYDTLSDEEKVEAISEIDQLAKEYGKISAGVGYRTSPGSSQYKILNLADKHGIPIAEIYGVKLYKDQLAKDDMLSTEDRKSKLVQMISSVSEWSEDQKSAVFSYATAPETPSIGEHKPSSEQKNSYTEIYGKYASEVYDSIVQSAHFAGLSDETKSAMIDKASDLVSFYAKREWASKHSIKSDSYDPGTVSHKYDTLLDAGFSFFDAYAINKKYDSISGSDGSKTDQATDFSTWVDLQSWSEGQKATIKSIYKIGQYMPVEPKTYNKLTSYGVAPNTANLIVSIVSALEPKPGKDNVSDIQKWQAIANSSKLSDSDKDNGIRAHMDENQAAKYNACRKAGVSSSLYVKYCNAKYTYGDANGYWNQEELKNWLNSQNISRSHKAALWKATNSGWTNNPFD